MKKSLILLSVCSAALLCSCATSSRYAYSVFDDGIYYRATPESRDEMLADSREVQELVERTRQEAARFSDTIVLAGTGSGTVNSITSTAAAYIPASIDLNINWYDYDLLGYGTYCSYWDWRYWDMFGPWGRYSGWANWYNWYSPWFPGIYDPWYPSWGWRWSFAWNSWGWYGPDWWYGPWGWYDPWYGWGYPVAGQPVYYGKRDTGVRTVSGERTMAARTVRGGMTTVRGRNAGTAATATTGRTGVSRASSSSVRSYRSTASSINLGEGYVSRGSATASSGRLAGSSRDFRRAAGTVSYTDRAGSSYRRADVTSGFRSPFESRGSSFSRGSATGFSRNANTTFNRSTTYNSTSRSSFNSGATRSVSRSSFSGGGGRSYSGGGTRSGGGVRR
ncbi:MAG TPA: hypothetical protein IAC03_07970 [Candidatus Coprenecus pullistercoris]|nr:hypothetical protein [Candidatus Coprenecus pullistercoris]